MSVLLPLLICDVADSYIYIYIIIYYTANQKRHAIQNLKKNLKS